MAEAAIATAAQIVAGARLGRQPLGAFDPALGIGTVDLGYRVQQAANDLLERRLGARIGHKIGGTNTVMQVYLGLAEPVAGEIFATTVRTSGARLRLADYRRPGIETEIAVRLGRDLPVQPEPHSAGELTAAVGAVMAAIELVDDRYRDFKTAGAPLIIADNAFNAASILGEPQRHWRDLALDQLAARTLIDGRVVAEGTSDALLGHPLTALAWLAERRRRLGLGLAEGSFVSLGTITPVQWLERGARTRIEIDGLGAVELELS